MPGLPADEPAASGGFGPRVVRCVGGWDVIRGFRIFAPCPPPRRFAGFGGDHGVLL